MLVIEMKFIFPVEMRTTLKCCPLQIRVKVTEVSKCAGSASFR